MLVLFCVASALFFAVVGVAWLVELAEADDRSRLIAARRFRAVGQLVSAPVMISTGGIAIEQFAAEQLPRVNRSAEPDTRRNLQFQLAGFPHRDPYRYRRNGRCMAVRAGKLRG